MTTASLRTSEEKRARIAQFAQDLMDRKGGDMVVREQDPRFAHHEFLAVVAGEDVRFLLEKDRKYGASWKRSGGRSAWFMLVRKIDRLQEIMRQPPPPLDWDDPNEAVVCAQKLAGGGALSSTNAARMLEHVEHLAECYVADNIFAMIRKGPDGEDGTALAEVRDLRRYLLLVEAEMMSRNVVALPEALSRGLPADAVVHDGVGQELADKAVAFEREYDALLNALSEAGIRAWTSGAGEITLRWASDSTPVGKEGWQRRTRSETERVGEVERTVSTTVESRSAAPRLEDGLENIPTGWTTVASVDSGPVGCGYSAKDAEKFTGKTYFNVNRGSPSTRTSSISEDQLSSLPTLRREVNWKEFMDLPAWYRGMYEWIESETKFRLLRPYLQWPGAQ